MLVPKRSAVFLLLVIGQIAQAMELAKRYDDKQCMKIAFYLKSTDDKIKNNAEECEKRKNFLSRDHETAKRVREYYDKVEECSEALKFLCSIPQMKESEFRANILMLNPDVSEIAVRLSESNILIFAAYERDVCFVLGQKYLPESYEDRRGFFNPLNHKGELILNPFEDNKAEVKKLSRDEMMNALRDMPFEKSLYIFNFIANDHEHNQLMELITRRENSVDDCMKGCIIRRIGERKELRYVLSYDEYRATPEALRKLLENIISKSDKQCEDGEMHFKITQEHVDLIKTTQENLKKESPEASAMVEKLLQMAILTNAKIRVDVSKPTWWQRIKDAFILKVPLGLIAIIPDFVNRQTTSFLPTLAGGIPCLFVSYIVGEYGYPFLDSFNSNMGKLPEWYGEKNHTRVKRGLTFLSLSAANYVCSALAQKFLSYRTIGTNLIGGTIHLIRLLPSFAASNYLAEYSRLSGRRNNEGRSYTFGDLLKGPKFAEVNKS